MILKTFSLGLIHILVEQNTYPRIQTTKSQLLCVHKPIYRVYMTCENRLHTLVRVKALKRMHFSTKSLGAILAKDTANSYRANARLA